MWDHSTLVYAILLEQVVGSRDTGCFGSFDTKLDFNTYTINDKYSAQSKSVIVKVESFYDSSTENHNQSF